jgi:exportin-1
MKEYSGEDADSFLVDKEAELAQKLKTEREAAMRVPGMLKPSQLDEEEL